MFSFWKYHEGDTCPECGKRKLVAITGHSLVTLGRSAHWLVCEGYPRCGFASLKKSNVPHKHASDRSAVLQKR